MGDRKLLELAAKAAGIVGTWLRCHQAYGDQWIEGMDCGGPILWNPLADDGDALRLLVKLRMRVEIDHYSAMVNSTAVQFVCGATDAERSVATRRAIVLAAVIIGKDMP